MRTPDQQIWLDYTLGRNTRVRPVRDVTEPAAASTFLFGAHGSAHGIAAGRFAGRCLLPRDFAAARGGRRRTARFAQSSRPSTTVIRTRSAWPRVLEISMHGSSPQEGEILTESIHRAICLAEIAARHRSRRAVAGCLAATLVLTAGRAPAAQEALISARDLYKAARYEEALVQLNTLEGSTRVASESRSAEQYRALCLLALGRTAEAERAIEAVVTAAPSFRPSEAEESPRIRSAFSDVRRRLLPGIIQEKYAQAKAAFDRHDSVAARAGFGHVLDLLADSDVAPAAEKPPLSELRTLAAGFRDLSARAAPLQSTSPLPAAIPPSVGAAAPRRLPGAMTAVEKDAARQPSPERVYGIEDADVVPPTVVRQSWAALADVFAVRTGIITIVIDATGAVESATMTAPVNPIYDRLALSTAKGWRYRPATVAGAPVKFRKVILLDLKTTR
jgi:hypothetical protein